MSEISIPGKRVVNLSGIDPNTMFCLSEKGFRPGQTVFGTAVMSLGFMGAVKADLKNLEGGEVAEITEALLEGRRLSIKRMLAEAQAYRPHGITAVRSSVSKYRGHFDYRALGSLYHAADGSPAPAEPVVQSMGGKDMYAALDAGYAMRGYAMGVIAYSVGFKGLFFGSIRANYRRGEVPVFSQQINNTRHLALKRLTDDARAQGANAVISTTVAIEHLMGCREMLMTGTAAHHPALEGLNPGGIASSELSGSELWSLTKMGYAPVQIVMASCVYAIGLGKDIQASLRAVNKGEITLLTEVFYEAREKVLDRLSQDAQAVGADEVFGTDIFLQDLGGGVIEFFAMGTAVKQVPGLATASETLPAQAIATHSESFTIAGGVVPYVSPDNIAGVATSVAQMAIR